MVTFKFSQLCQREIYFQIIYIVQLRLMHLQLEKVIPLAAADTMALFAKRYDLTIEAVEFDAKSLVYNVQSDFSLERSNLIFKILQCLQQFWM